MDIGESLLQPMPRIRDEIGDKSQKHFHKFLSEFIDIQLDPNQSVGESDLKLKYQDDALALKFPDRNTLFVDYGDVVKHNQPLATLIVEELYRLYPYLCRAVTAFALDCISANPEALATAAAGSLTPRDSQDVADPVEEMEQDAAAAAQGSQQQGPEAAAQAAAESARKALRSKEIFVGFYNLPSRLKMRELKSIKMGTMVRITGQVVRTHTVHPELLVGAFECIDCGAINKNIAQQFKYTAPAICRNPQCNNRSRFKAVLHMSRFVDFQRIRIQETQAELPRGSIPRSMDVILRGSDQAECIQPGDKADFIGTLIVVPDVAALITGGGGQVRQETGIGDGVSGLKVLGVREMSHKIGFLANCALRENSTIPAPIEMRRADSEGRAAENFRRLFTDEELKRIDKMRGDKNLLDNICKTLFTATFGHDEIKRGIVLMMFGGVPKTTAEGTTLRGDINICIVGDPSTAKSQFLKSVAEFAPTRAVYTSGKASSASGLTAAVVRDEDGGFVIEAGALMLADQGICCIDEFDKMDLKDQVAIHEAMEQQTISITKAGVKATLNARTSILAAANPIGGHYDRAKSLRSNISLSLPIMSRFDLFFVLIDDADETTDRLIARRILDMHTNTDIQPQDRPVYTLPEIRSYIKFARHFKPKLTKDAERLLVKVYKQLRLAGTGQAGLGGSQGPRSGPYNTWRITVRQLESLVRLSEATARLHCESHVTSKHVEEAAKLLEKSIVKIVQPDIELVDRDDVTRGPEDLEEQDQENVAPMSPEPGAGGEEQIFKMGLSLPYEKYIAMANKMVIQLRREEAKLETAAAAAAGGGADGMRRSELVEWYLAGAAAESEIESEAELIRQKVLCERVLDRLIKQDHIIIPLSTATGTAQIGGGDPAAGDGGSGEDLDPILVVHPNYDPEI